jgi:hypothetical protein
VDNSNLEVKEIPAIIFIAVARLTTADFPEETEICLTKNMMTFLMKIKTA